jgi:hypothetical protein
VAWVEGIGLGRGGEGEVRNRVAIFREQNYSAEYRQDQNRRQFCRISACFAEKKNLGIPLQTISQKKKPSEFRSEPFLGREKPSEFRFELFLDEKNLGILF